MAPRKQATAADTTPTTVTPISIVPATPTAIALDLRHHTTITLVPLAERRRAERLTLDAQEIAVIGSSAALETADALASALKAMESEIVDNVKAQLAPVEGLLKAAKGEIASIVEPMIEARTKLTERVVLAKEALGYEAATSCYSQDRPELEIRELRKIPHFVTYTDPKSGEQITEQLLKPDNAAINRALKAGAHVPGVYQGTATVYGTRST